jgi:hypothetical protein
MPEHNQIYNWNHACIYFPLFLPIDKGKKGKVVPVL